jgi:hypothetical protein
MIWCRISLSVSVFASCIVSINLEDWQLGCVTMTELTIELCSSAASTCQVCCVL